MIVQEVAMRHLFPFPSFHLCAFYERRADQARTADPATAQSHGHDAGRTGLTDGRFTSVRCQMGDGPVITGHRPSGPVAGRTPNEPRRAHHPRRQGILPGPRPSCEGSPTSCPAERTAHSRPLPFILGILLCCCGLGGLGVLWVLSRVHPVRLVDWNASLHTGLEGYMMATGLWPVLLLACLLLGCGSLTLLSSGAQAGKQADP